MQNPRPGYPDCGGSSGPIRLSSRLGHRTPSPSPYARPTPEDDETVPDSQEETIHLPTVLPPPQRTERDKAYFEKAIRGIPGLASAAAEDRGAPFREALVRTLLGAILIISEEAGLANLLSLLRNHPEFGDIVTAIETEAIDLWSSTHPMPPNKDPTPARLTAIENTLAQVLASLKNAQPPPMIPKQGQSSTSPLPKTGQKKNQPIPANKGKGGPPAPQSTSEAPASGATASKAGSALPSQAQSYAAATANPRKFNPSPKEPSAFRKKKHDEQRFGEVLFTPSPAFPKDNDADCPLSGSGGIAWTPRGNVLLTPTSPDMWDILAKQGAAALSHLHNGRTFYCLTHGPTRDLVVHGIPARATGLPKVDNVCLSLAAGLSLDPHDIVQAKSRWLVSSRSPNLNKRPLFLVSLTTDEVAEPLLHRNPHWIKGDRITFKEFSTAPTVPNQCRRCWKVGHPTWRCGVSNPVCTICAEFHETLTHACSFQGCTERGKACEHATKTCPNCGSNHPAWDKACIECLIQKAAQPPKKKGSPPQPKKAAPDSPAKAAADFIRSIPQGAPGYPQRDITHYKDIELVKKFRAWCLYNKLPVIGPNDDPTKWAPPTPAPSQLHDLPPHGLQLVLDSASDTHHIMVVSELPWHNIGGNKKGTVKVRGWDLALPLNPLPADTSPRVAIFVNKSLLPDHGITIHPTFNSPGIIHAHFSAHSRRLAVVGVYRSPNEPTSPDSVLSKLTNWDVPISDTISDWADDEGLHLLNDPSIPTHIAHARQKDSVLDLSMVNSGLLYNWTAEWSHNQLEQTADHFISLSNTHRP
ncbi:hypothetical protein BOTBODRAFT_180153 [Botryobasidium botryosum FD-172 SS1]|uniref:Endonuclease/exonuclease/phosphatase domain-containing protein n=1 Tax=Botryobasidium botryosum (strain FD-172 SS1) TaxID=930990 RepID=A0A067LXL3_BOTB1|nr:hypothetical protein BOTBODRAFT_180153 [Botryobasidium botryosum FD-172 SS1]